MKARVVNSRLRLLLLVILLTFAALGVRVAWLQTVRASSLARLAQRQTKFDLELPASRGTIYDRLGTPLAIGEQATDVIADPMQISEPRHEARVAAKVLGIPVRPLYRALADRSRGFVYVQRKASPKVAAQLAKRNLTGFTFQQDERRVRDERAPRRRPAAQREPVRREHRRDVSPHDQQHLHPPDERGRRDPLPDVVLAEP